MIGRKLYLFYVLFSVLVLQFCSVCYASKKNFKDHYMTNQMEPVHSVRHMARLMRRMLAEESDIDANATTASLSSESPTVTTVTTTTTNAKTASTSASTTFETVSHFHRELKTNQSIGGHLSYDIRAMGAQCPGFLPCDQLNVECIVCDFNRSCVYGKEVTVPCQVKGVLNCQGTREFNRTMICRYCYQTPETEHECNQNVTCRVVSSPRQRFISKCNVLPHVLCLEPREFQKNMLCNWSKGYSWTTTLMLSIVLGGFGVDRFYLGMWQEGIGKLFSFGGLGVWTLVDVILIATGYLGPADGSLYIP